MANRYRLLAGLLFSALIAAPAGAQDLPPHVNYHALNRPLPSLHSSALEARSAGVPFTGSVVEIPNKAFKSDTRTQTGTGTVTGVVQTVVSAQSPVSALRSFDGSDNDDNAVLLGYRMSPPDPDADVGPNHIVQVINSVTTIFDKAGNELGGGPFPTNALWNKMRGLCETYNRGDPVVLYDETDDRWLISQFAFSGVSASPYSQCVAVSQTGDPLGAYNRYEFDFSDIGFNDYPKLGFTSDAVTLMANIFQPPTLSFAGAFLGALDKQAMLDGRDANMVGAVVSGWGFAAADLDDATGTAGYVPALFATAMMRGGYLDLWQVDPDFAAGTASVYRTAEIPISPFSSDLCDAPREACIPQPAPGTTLEAISGRMMYRLAVRDFGTHQSMVMAHTVDAGGGRAGIRWYEVRNYGSGWELHQQSTFAPNDGLYRWMPSIAMNAAGDIGLGYLVSSDTHFMSIGVAGQTAASSGSGALDTDEILCVEGTGSQTNSNRSGDYSATRVDPITDTFWHANEYVQDTGSYKWKTRVCEFSLSGTVEPLPEPTPEPAPEPTPDPTPEPAPEPDPEQFVWSITTGTTSASKGRKHGTAVVTILDDRGNPVADAWVSGRFSGDFNESGGGTTAPDGTLTFQTSSTRKMKGEGTIYFCVSGVTHSGLTYNPARNPVPSYQCPDAPTDDNSDVHVSAVTASVVNGAKGTKRGSAAVTVRDSYGNVVAGYTVTGTFFGSLTEGPFEAMTDGAGIASFRTSGTLDASSTLSFCVAAVVGALPYDPSKNADPSFDCSSGKGVTAGFAETRPAGFTLDQNYPNPFNPTTVIPFMVTESMPVRLAVYDLLGRQVAVLMDEVVSAGLQRATFDASRLPAGLYLYVLEAGGEREVRRMTLLK